MEETSQRKMWVYYNNKKRGTVLKVLKVNSIMARRTNDVTQMTRGRQKSDDIIQVTRRDAKALNQNQM